jgi:hypothetical protein|tara:strand:- start:774 stop:989 length:216 start_codon:yes stop_codon:yes gene_type:complete
MITDYLKHLNNNTYIIKREVATHNFSIEGKNGLNMELVQEFMRWLECDHVLRTQTHFLFCETIADAVVVED